MKRERIIYIDGPYRDRLDTESIAVYGESDTESISRSDKTMATKQNQNVVDEQSALIAELREFGLVADDA